MRSHRQFILHTNTEVLRLGGKRRQEEVVARNRSTGEELLWLPAAAFVFIGLTPNTDFVRGAVSLDECGFVTIDGVFQTSLPGVFAAGEVRTGSTKTTRLRGR